MADPIPDTAFENSFHALRRYKMPTFLSARDSGLSKDAHSRLSAAYKAFYSRQEARRAAYAEAEKASAFFRQQAEALITRVGHLAALDPKSPGLPPLVADFISAAEGYVRMLEVQYLARIAALGIDPAEAPPEGTPAAMDYDTEAAKMPETEEAAA